MITGGFAGQVLHVNLSEQRTWTEPLDETIVRDYVGGLGICIKLASDLILPGAAPLSPESVFILGAGPLVGTDLPASSRIYVVGKLPASGTVGWCGAGGYSFGVQLKYAGYDHVIVSGMADRPVYLEIDDNRVNIRDAKDVWGWGVDDTCKFFYNKSDEMPGVLAIGPAGENKSAIAMAFVDRISTLGRGGFGAVMGSKNLKAIVVRGTGSVTVSDRKRFKKMSDSVVNAIRTYPYLKEWQDLGMLKAFPMVPVDVYKRMKQRRTACVSCPVGCKDVVRIPDGPFKGLVKHTSSAINLFTPMMYGMKDPFEAVKLITDLDDYGIDMFEFFGLMGLMRDLAASGAILLKPDEPEIDLTSLSSMTAWAKKIARREGTGDLLADGFTAVIEKLGEKLEPEAKKQSLALIKGMHPYAGPGAALPWDRFGTMELGQVLDPRGPHVGSGGSPTYFALRPLAVFPKHLKRMGVPEDAVDRILGPDKDELHIGRLLRYSHAWFATLGSLGLCARGQVNRFYNADLCAEAYEAATGIPTTAADLRKRIDRIWTTFREINIREGLDDSKEALPDQWFKKSGFKDYLSGEPLTKEQAEEMKREYFDEWGWS
jgi:aldehyde:ferredoxin oxidoreductase